LRPPRKAAATSTARFETLRLAASHHEDDAELRAELARKFIARGDVTTAAEYLTAETAGNDPELLLMVANMKLQGDGVEDGLANRAPVARAVRDHGASRFAQLGWTVAEKQPEAGFKVVELAADSAVAQTDWPAAAAALQEFVTRVPNHVPALMRLVEICVDGGLESTMYSAQGAAGRRIHRGWRRDRSPLHCRGPGGARAVGDVEHRTVSPRARVDGRTRSRRSHRRTVERRVAIHEHRLAVGESLFDDPPVVAEPAPAPEPEMAIDDLLSAAADAEEPPKNHKPSIPKPKPRVREDHHFELSANAIDPREHLLGDFDSAPPPKTAPKAHAANEDVEVDLSIDLDGIKPGAAAKAAPALAPKSEPTADLDGIFGNLRDQASKRSGLDEAEKEYKRGLALRAAGRHRRLYPGAREGVARAEAALRHVVADRAALSRARPDAAGARMAGARRAGRRQPTNDESHQLLFELADGLEKTGEVARALAICLELQADAGEYKDVSTRIDRLTRVQAGG